MIRQSISLTAPEEYSSKSEIVNDLIRKARAQQTEVDVIRTRLIQAETSGFVLQSPEEMRAEFKEALRRNQA